MKILNLYAGIGGNRKLWGNNHEITAVELNPEIAKIYSDFFPKDNMVVGDAHQFLLDHFKEFDFIWSSPPCQSHSVLRQNLGVRCGKTSPIYPDMKLYQEILFLKCNAKCYYVVENVKPYYSPLIVPSHVLARHLFWCNFEILNRSFDTEILRKGIILSLSRRRGVDLSTYKISNKRQLLSNCVLPEIGLHILNCALDIQSF